MYKGEKYTVVGVEIVSDNNHGKDCHLHLKENHVLFKGQPWDRQEYASGRGSLWWCQDDLFWTFTSYPNVVGARGFGIGAYSGHFLDRKSRQIVYMRGGWSSRAGIANLIIGGKLMMVSVVHNGFQHFTRVEKGTLEAIFKAFGMPHKVVRKRKYSFPLVNLDEPARNFDKRDLHADHSKATREMSFGVSGPVMELNNQ